MSSTITRRLLLALATTTTLAACTSTVTGTPTPQKATHSSNTQTPATTAPSSGTSQTPGSGRSITLGDLDKRVDAAAVGAPFDPCAVGWQAFPEAVRPTKPEAKPVLRPPRDNDPFATSCRYDNGDTVTVEYDANGKPTTNTGKDFIVIVAWAKPEQNSADPNDFTGSKPATYAGKPGLLKPGTDSKGNAMCTAIVQLANGVAGVSLTNGRFTHIDSCTIATTVANHIASTTP
ncbi:DUF3558 family protein [Saccharothrix sp. NPDC042600]|uniref:DUF3558 family protein n=1 Tax=Saccharothrix TaxID=2071 RepID=UPI003411E098|nr:hypothetical protein GCM10017745_45920 [Saccharothrix mutabilis subsp. capreolus]